MDSGPLLWHQSAAVASVARSPPTLVLGARKIRICCHGGLDCTPSRHRGSPILVAAFCSGVPALAAVRGGHNGRRRWAALQRRASMDDRELEQHLVEQVTSRGSTLEEMKTSLAEQWLTGLDCPECRGGEQKDTAFCVRLKQNDGFEYRCHRCGFKGELLRPKPTQRTAADRSANGKATGDVVKEELNRPPVPKGVAYHTDEDRQRVMERIRDEGDPIEIYGVSTGWRSLDEYYRVVPGELTIATGTPGSGKSEWLLSLASNIASERGWRFLLFAFEADDRYLAIQLMEKKKQTEYKHISMDDLDEVFHWIDDDFSLGHNAFASSTIDDILALAQQEAESERGLQGMIIDPYNFIDRSNATGMIETDFISVMLAKIKRFAYEHKVHVWVIAHPTKSSSWGESASKPSMYDISGSANWYNRADMGIVIQRKVLAIGDDVIPDRKIQIHIEKVRSKDAGQLGKVELVFAKEQRGYLEMDDSFGYVPEAVEVLS